MSVPFIDLQSQYADLEISIKKGIEAVLDHGKYIMGPEVMELESQLAAMSSTKHVLSCSSGTDALVIALMAYDVGPGDAIFTTPFTFVATAEAIETVGATPVFVDINAQTLNIDTQKLSNTILRVKQEGKLKPRGIMPVDLFGLPADYDAVTECAKQHDLFVIGDGAQSMGSTYKGIPSATYPDMWTTSFFPAKPLGCYGDGGAVFTNNDELIQICQSIRVHGKGTTKYDTIRRGLNGRLDTIQAAVLLAKLPRFLSEIDKRQAAADRYTTNLRTPDGLSENIRFQTIPQGYQSAWAQYSILSPKRESIMTALKAEGIPTAIYYGKPLHLQPAFSHLEHHMGDFPVSEKTSTEIFSLPMHPYIDSDQIDRTCHTILKTTENH